MSKNANVPMCPWSNGFRRRLRSRCRLTSRRRLQLLRLAHLPHLGHLLMDRTQRATNLRTARRKALRRPRLMSELACLLGAHEPMILIAQSGSHIKEAPLVRRGSWFTGSHCGSITAFAVWPGLRRSPHRSLFLLEAVSDAPRWNGDPVIQNSSTVSHFRSSQSAASISSCCGVMSPRKATTFSMPLSNARSTWSGSRTR
jgi:hypothetical protein